MSTLHYMTSGKSALDESAETKQAVLEIAELRKTFEGRGARGPVAAVDGISLRADPGEMIVLLGPSGCGKTTLLRCVAGLEIPDEGTVSVSDKVVFSSSRRKNTPPEHRMLSMMFQSYALWPHMTAAGNVAYPLESRGLQRQEIKSRVAEVLDAVGIPQLANELPHAMSGGQQQRVALARALVAATPLILFDEPLSNVDAKVRDELIIEIKRMQNRFGFSGLYVTHDQSEALALGDRVAVLDAGKVVEIGAPREVYHSPRSRYTARFIGSSNEFSGTARVAGDSLQVDTEIGVVVSRRADARNMTGDAYAIFRPSDCRIVDEQSAPPGENTWSGVVETATFRGTLVELEISIGNRLLKVSTDSRSHVPKGASVAVTVDAANVLVFAPEERP